MCNRWDYATYIELVDPRKMIPWDKSWDKLLGQLRIIFDCCCVVLLSENCFINGKNIYHWATQGDVNAII